MNDCPTLMSAPHPAARPADLPRRHYSLATLPSLIAIWRERIRFRRGLEEMWKANPHMIEDIGLKRWQAEAEIAKPFWQP
ncbi:hypothetical protein GCM10007874_39140 [Labrys miyagiensis]|uniref:DUF1127 domain-containing protein n=1 Tax=Labrys miyagiensis TaxID=346912 RepID=A0ABQ6CKL3_9HYPH|nr:DUF1127 domain-containing protein [Labrys miyagiensis]GLS20897.1 hypothetical protein GCM10007874_39140 [Labrys miyagiensis]